MRKLSPTLERLMFEVLMADALTIRNVAGGEESFVYSTGNRGPFYFMIKGLVSRRPLFTALSYQLAVRVLDEFPDIEYVAGNVTGGMIPGWVVHEALEKLTGREIPYIYVRDTRKKGGHHEQITGDKNYKQFFKPGRKGLVLEELANYAQTTCNSAIVQREAGYDVRHAACIVTFGHKHAANLLSETGLKHIYLFEVRDLFDLSSRLGIHNPSLIRDAHSFLDDPSGWQLKHGFNPTQGE